MFGDYFWHDEEPPRSQALRRRRRKQLKQHQPDSKVRILDRVVIGLPYLVLVILIGLLVMPK
jgi:hypothetical protein